MILQLLRPQQSRHGAQSIQCLACAFSHQQTAAFSTTQVLEARKKGKPKTDRRISESNHDTSVCTAQSLIVIQQ